MYNKLWNPKKTPQSQPIRNRKMVENNAGGYVFELDGWKRLERFLILGTTASTYYASAQDMTRMNAESLINCIEEDGARVLQTLLDIRKTNRAIKQGPTIFALALLVTYGNQEVVTATYRVLHEILRAASQLFEFISYTDSMRGWGSGLRKAINTWYFHRQDESLAYQLVKYRQRNGWTHRDVFRMTHPKVTGVADDMVRYAVKGEYCESLNGTSIQGFELAKQAETVDEVVQLITDYGLTHEMIPDQFKKEQRVWTALLNHMPMTALIRNLNKMTAVGVFDNFDSLRNVVDRLTNPEQLRWIHPVTMLNAHLVYRSGKGSLGNLTWKPVTAISDALMEGFYTSFGSIQPTNKRYMLALDVSGSMTRPLSGMPMMSAREASAVMAMVTARTERFYEFFGFSTSFVELDISAHDSLDEVVRKISGHPFAGTDCAYPMYYAAKNKIEVDCFVIYTDNETWYGDMHPVQALEFYNKTMGRNAKVAVVGMTATEFSIADPQNPDMMDFVGFDTNTPRAIGQFVAE